VLLGGIDYDNSTVTAIFNAGSTIAIVKIPIFNDNVVNEKDEIINLTLNLSSTTDISVTSGIRSIANAVIIDTSMLII